VRREGKGTRREREGRKGEGRSGMPVQFGSLDPPVEEGREGRRTMRGTWVGACRQFYFFYFKH